MLKDIRGTLATLVDEARINKDVTMYTARHTYIASRLQTMDNGHPVSPYTVMKEAGHKSFAMIEKHYGHLLETRHRIPVVEYREAEVVPLQNRRKRA